MPKIPEIHFTKKAISIISILLGAAALATTCAYLIYRYTSLKAYRKKWCEYDECGLM